MKKKSESGDAGKRTRKKSSPAKGARIIPSRMWGQGGRAILRSLAFRERVLIVMGIFVPALDQISRLGSLGVTMKAVGMGIREPLDFDARLVLGFIILGATGITALIQVFSGRVKKNLKVQNTRMVRRIYGGIVAEAARLPLKEREAEVKNLISEERNFMASAVSGVSAVIEFFAAIFLVLILLGILTWFNWIVGVILLAAGLVALVVLKRRIKSAPQTENEELHEAKKILTGKLESIAWRRDNTDELIEAYADNEFDSLTFAETEARTKLQKKISSAMSFGSAILMAVVFLLVSAEGAFDENKVVWMVVFIFGLRMVVSFGKMAMVKWGTILAEKNTMMMLAKEGLEERNREDKTETIPGMATGNPWTFPLGERILVLGDGHVRSYADNSNFFPVMLGPGKLCNFTSDECAEFYSSKVQTILENVEGETVILVFGEPDSRFALGRGWQPREESVDAGPHPDQIPGEKQMTEALQLSVQRMKQMVDALSAKYKTWSFYIAPVFPVALREQSVLIAELNKLLLSTFGDRFLVVNEAMTGTRTYLTGRALHSNGIQKWIERELLVRGLINRSGMDSDTVWDSEKVQGRFKSNECFGCLTYEKIT